MVPIKRKFFYRCAECSLDEEDEVLDECHLVEGEDDLHPGGCHLGQGEEVQGDGVDLKVAPLRVPDDLKVKSVI